MIALTYRTDKEYEKMTTIIRPIIGGSALSSTLQRTALLFSPIQKTKTKQSDLTAYLARPIIDSVILEPIFAIDAAIELLNATVSYAKAWYLWAKEQVNDESVYGGETVTEAFDVAFEHLINSFCATIAELLNATLSIIALFTRPIASLVHALAGDTDVEQHQEANTTNVGYQTTTFGGHSSSLWAVAAAPATNPTAVSKAIDEAEPSLQLNK